MHKIIFNEKQARKITESAKGLVELLENKINDIENQDSDIFDRYFDVCRLRTFLQISKEAWDGISFALVAGHSLAHPILQTESAKIAGWDIKDIDDKELFCFTCEKSGYKSTKEAQAEEKLDKLESFLDALADKLAGKRGKND